MSPLNSAAIALVCCLVAGCSNHLARHDNFETSVATASAKDDWAASTVPYADGRTIHAWGEPETISVAMPAGPQAVADSDGEYLLDTGDRLRVFVYGQPNLSRLYTVDHAGNIVIPLIGKVHARGTTIYRLAARIRDRLGAEYVRDPQVTVDINENRPFFVMGEVRQGGQFPYVSGMTVKTAIAIAGGYSERANTRSSRVTRRINGIVEVLDVSSDYVLKPGDIVEIRERFF